MPDLTGVDSIGTQQIFQDALGPDIAATGDEVSKQEVRGDGRDIYAVFQLAEDGKDVCRVAREELSDEVRPDKAGAAGDQD